MLARSRRRTRGRAARSLGIVVLTASVLALSVAVPAAALPSDQPGGTTGVLDSDALDELQRRGAQGQGGRQEQQARVAEARQAQQEAEAAVQAAQQEFTDAEGELADYQEAVARYAA